MSAESFLQWNSYVFSFKNQTARIFVNGIQIASQPIQSKIINTASPTCVIGNSQSGQNGFNGHMRHLVFSKIGLDQNTPIVSIIRSVAVPTDSNLLSSF